MESFDAIAALGALAHEHRLAVFRALVQRGPAGLAAGELARQLALAPATLSFHLAQLSSAGLVQSTRHGRSIIYAAAYAQMDQLISFLMANCCSNQPDAPGCPPLTIIRTPVRAAPKGKTP